MARSLWSIFILLGVTGFFIFGAFILKESIAAKTSLVEARFSNILKKIQAGESFVISGNFSEAKKYLTEAHDDINQLRNSLGMAYKIVSGASKILPERIADRFPFAFIDIAYDITSQASRLSSLSSDLQSKFIASLFDNSSSPLEELILMREQNLELIQSVSRLQNAVPPEILSIPLPSHKVLEKSNEGFEALLWALGNDQPRSFLLLFQNPAEARATGGFIGSYATLKLDKGKLKEFLFEDMAATDKEFDKLILPPRPLRRIAKTWKPSDANWFLDFPTSAKKVSWFIEQTNDINADGVIALNPQAISRILSITGPIEMPEYKKVLDENNFWEEMQIATREDYSKNQPKQFLQNFTTRFLDKVRSLPPDKISRLLDTLRISFSEKDIQVYLEEAGAQQVVLANGWGGKVFAEPQLDFLSIGNTNIGGEKSDYFVRQKISLQTEVQADGEIINELAVTRRHEGRNAKYSWWRAKNYEYLRIYVPGGSQFISASGGDTEPKLKNIDSGNYIVDPDIGYLAGDKMIPIDAAKTVEVFEESGKTVFATWILLEPGEAKTFKIRYQLPFDTGFSSPSYKILVEKQSGIKTSFSHQIQLPRDSVLTKGELNVEKDLDESFRRAISFKFPLPH